MRRAQSAIEFTLITTAMLLIFSVAIIVAQSSFLKIAKDQSNAAVEALMDQVETEVTLAAKGGVGYSRTFSLPETISGDPYSITIDQVSPPGSDELVVIAQGKEHLRFLAYDVTGNVKKGNNTIQGGTPIRIN